MAESEVQKTETEKCGPEVRAKLWVAGSAVSMISKHTKHNSNYRTLYSCIRAYARTCVRVWVWKRCLVHDGMLVRECVCPPPTASFVSSNIVGRSLDSIWGPSHPMANFSRATKTGVVFHPWPHVGSEVWRGI